MSDSPVPAYVDTRKIFLQQGAIAGFVALERLPRFAETLASDEGSVSAELAFERSDSGQNLIRGHVRAEVEVICQRCLEPLVIRLEDDIRLALVKDEAQAEALEEGLEPWICADTKLDLASLVEEQLMLCMPIVSFHENSDCGQKLGYLSVAEAATANGKPGVANPFSVLKSLKKDSGTN